MLVILLAIFILNGIFMSDSFTSFPRLHVCHSDNRLYSTITIATNGNTVSEETESVHLKLTQQYDIDNNIVDNSSIITVLEYVNKENNTTILASIGANKTKLEMFSDLAFKKNLSADIDVYLREKQVNLSDSETSMLLLQLWKSERLLSQTKDPLTSTSSSKKQNFKGMMLAYVNRIRTIYNDTSSEEEISQYLNKILVNGQSASSYSFNGTRSRHDTLKALKDFAIWFKSEFPYYYDNCQSCGNRDGNEFVGYVMASSEERVHLAGQTEIYHCAQCSYKSRFPRFNAVGKVIHTKRGRCGEYSILLLRMLHTLNYKTRWIVDWADHVWVEVLVDGSWIHVDPCEAAIDEPLLYQGWGKNQTYIFAFSNDDVADVTSVYTSNISAAIARRDTTPDLIEDAINSARSLLIS